MNDKPVCLVTAPVATRSGYGAHSRDICRALIKLDKYEVKILSVRWGNCPMNALHAVSYTHLTLPTTPYVKMILMIR